MPYKIIVPIEGGNRIPLPEEKRELLEKIIDGFVTRHRGALRHTESTVRNQLSIIHNFLKFVGRAPWECTESDFENWCDNLFDARTGKRLAASSQRKYQSTIQQFYHYMIENIHFSHEIRERFGIVVRQIVTPENKIPHVNPQEKERPPFTREEIDQFFAGIDREILEAQSFRHKDFHVLRRDKVFFFTQYAVGLRIGECCRLNIDSFKPNPRMPEFGNYGFVSVAGKGSKGSGLKFRTVPVIHPALPNILDWYIQSVRTQYLRKADPNERALFLSDQGNRVSRSGMTARFHRCTDLAGIERRKFVPHCLRHSFATHMAEMGMSLEFSRLSLGHVYGETTQQYTHLGDSFIQEEAENAAKVILDKMLSDKGG